MEKFLTDLLQKCKDHKIKIILDPSKVEFSKGSEVSGLYDSTNSEMTVGINKPIEEWLPILVHESCHLDQHTENCKVWQDCTFKDFDTLHILEMWLAEVVELTEEQLQNIIDRILSMELDCERRSIEKIKKYKLPIDVTEYTQKANAYMFFYRALMRTRKWSTKEKSPYKSEEVWKQMPTKLYDEHSDYSEEDPLTDLIINECF